MTVMRRLLAPLASPETYRALLYQLVGLALGSVAFGVLIAGWTTTLVLAITPLVFPLLFALRWVVGQLARVQGLAADALLGTSTSVPTRTTRGASFWTRALNVLRDPAFWKQQAQLLLSWPMALVPLAVLSWGLQLLTLPVWQRWVDSSDVFGFLEIDSFVETLPAAAAGFVVLLGLAHALGPYTRFCRWLASRLLTGEPGRRRFVSPAELRARRFRALTILSLVSTSIVVVLVVIWELTSDGGYFWPIWPLLSLALVVGIPGWIVAVLENPDIPRITLGSRALAIQVGVSVVVSGFLVGVWAITGGGYFWPVWAALGFALLAAVHAAVVYGLREHRIERMRASRDAAVDVQEAELRRIERDLHDGAQARLVALGMSIGMAEEKLRTDPEGAMVLLAEARRGREAGARGAPRPRAGHPPADPHGPRARGGSRGARPTRARCRSRSPPTSHADRRRPSRPPPTSSSPRRSRMRSSTRMPTASTSGCGSRTARSSPRSRTTAGAARTPRGTA